MAVMHGSPGLLVERNVLLPAVGNPGRKRETDVLLTSAVAGYRVRFAIECKNEKGVVQACRWLVRALARGVRATMPQARWR